MSGLLPPRAGPANKPASCSQGTGPEAALAAKLAEVHASAAEIKAASGPSGTAGTSAVHISATSGSHSAHPATAAHNTATKGRAAKPASVV